MDANTLAQAFSDRRTLHQHTVEEL
jgi:hypothetical protein